FSVRAGSHLHGGDVLRAWREHLDATPSNRSFALRPRGPAQKTLANRSEEPRIIAEPRRTPVRDPARVRVSRVDENVVLRRHHGGWHQQDGASPLSDPD